MLPTERTVVIIGAGAAGLMAAIHAASPSHRTLMLDRTSDGGRKILISGGGRCNVLPGAPQWERYVSSASAHLLRKIFRSWSPEAMRRFFEEEARLPLRLEAATGKLFPVADRSRAVRDALRRLCAERGVEFRGNCEVTRIAPHSNGWQIEYREAGNDAAPLRADALIVATGGLSVPETGSDGFAFRHLAALGHTIHPTYPALTPLTLDPPRFSELAGVSLDVTVTAQSELEHRVASGGFLFTHRGFSGPALLDVSHVAVRARLARAPHAALTINWGGDDPGAWDALLTPSVHQLRTLLRQRLPHRLVDRLLAEIGIDPTTQLAQLRRAERGKLLTALTAWPLPWTSDAGYRKAEVTGGGVALDEVLPQTMESRRHPRLYLAGELLDVFGPIGGYNFTWAWLTGRLAGLGAARAVRDAP